MKSIAQSILLLRGQKVLLQAVKRNRERFPEDFMFQLTADELGRPRVMRRMS